MTATTFSLALTAILGSAGAQALIKHGMDRVGGISFSGSQFFVSMQKVLTEPFILGGLGLIIIVAPMWFEVLSKLPLSVAYPMVSIGYIVAVGIGVIFLKESIPPLRIVGVVFIMVGVAALSRS